MKKLLILNVFNILILVNYSCSKENFFDPQNFESSIETFNKIRKINSFDARRNAFNTLTNQEKVNFWVARLDRFIIENELNAEQIFSVNEVKNMIKPDYFVYDSPQNIGFDMIVMDDIIDYLKDKFTGLQIYNMLFEINSQLKIIDAIDNNNSNAKVLSVCSCAIGSRYTCGRINKIEFIGIGIDYGECSGSGCVTDGGCGGFWTQKCTGSKCSY